LDSQSINFSRNVEPAPAGVGGAAVSPNATPLWAVFAAHLSRRRLHRVRQ
jgi:hypothetical protein